MIWGNLFLCVSFDLLKAEPIEANFFLVRKIINKFSPWLDEYIDIGPPHTHTGIEITANIYK